ncbi:MAG: hypothetical protein SFY66_20030, partial [Oculatellaceae cyanobacterium bins.114]|nr:hypothetical protein [Oculatellaceae cyanobacterium bins.114]
LFGIGQPQAHEWVHKLGRVLNQALGYEKQLPEREPHRLEEVLNECPSAALNSHQTALQQTGSCSLCCQSDRWCYRTPHKYSCETEQ